MSKYKKCMIVDGIVIAVGIIGTLYMAVQLLLAFQNNIEFDFNGVLPLPLAIFFTIYGVRQLNIDKKKHKNGEL